jgi:polyphosphate glucokinase
MRVLAIDVGGTNIKMLCSGETEPRKFPSGPSMTAGEMVEGVLAGVADWTFDVVSIGYPGPVLHGRPASEPAHLGGGWIGFDFAAAFGKPVRLINDAAMQALGSYRSGSMLFLGFGTGLGTAMIVDDVLEPMELAHLPYKKATYEDYVGARALERLGKKKWRLEVAEVVERMKAAFEPDEIVLGGGNAKLIKDVPAGCRLGANNNAFPGGFRLWDGAAAKEAVT